MLFLDVVIDRFLTFGRQVNRVVERVRKRVRVIRELTGRSWGWNSRRLVRVVESVMWYAASV